MILGTSWFASLFAIVIYLLFFLLIVWVAYRVIRKAVKDGILDARANIKELEESQPHSPYPPVPQPSSPSAPQPPHSSL
ncbi:MAG: hypothetical protein VB027_04180 [Gordonibacter sp.]|nr:hypothetical protein [Gordonibacter sp.]